MCEERVRSGGNVDAEPRRAYLPFRLNGYRAGARLSETELRPLHLEPLLPPPSEMPLGA
jgi:hypothetical protein